MESFSSGMYEFEVQGLYNSIILKIDNHEITLSRSEALTLAQYIMYESSNPGSSVYDDRTCLLTHLP